MGFQVHAAVSADLKTWMPEAKCFSVRNLQYMRLFASIYGDSEITHQVGAQIVHQLGDQLQLGQFEAQPIFPSLLLALRTIPARAAAESHFGDGGSADGALLLRVDLQLLDELALRSVNATEVMDRRSPALDRELEDALRLPRDRVAFAARKPRGGTADLGLFLLM